MTTTKSLLAPYGRPLINAESIRRIDYNADMSFELWEAFAKIDDWAFRTEFPELAAIYPVDFLLTELPYVETFADETGAAEPGFEPPTEDMSWAYAEPVPVPVSPAPVEYSDEDLACILD